MSAHKVVFFFLFNVVIMSLGVLQYRIYREHGRNLALFTS